MLWLILEQVVRPPDGLDEEEGRKHRWVYRGALALLVLISVQVVYGAFVAGTHAGHLFATFPDFGGTYWPEGIASIDPLWRDLRDNPVTLHVLHRGLGVLLLILIPMWSVFAHRAIRSQAQRLAAALMVSLVVAQVGLGIVTVLFSVPTVLGVAHQLGGMALLSCAVFAVFVFGKRAP